MNSMFISQIYKIILFLLLFVSIASAQPEVNGLKLITPGRIVGQNGDTIYNAGSNVWQFSGDTLKGVVIPGLETIALANNTYWVNPAFPNTGKFYSTIQAAINACPSPTNETEGITINILGGRYSGFNCAKSYITFLGIGDVIIDSLYTSEIQVVVNGIKIKMSNLKFTNARIPALQNENLNFKIINMDNNATLTLDNCYIQYTDFTNNTATDGAFANFFCVYSAINLNNNLIVKNCNFDVKYIASDDDNGNVSTFGIYGIFISTGSLTSNIFNIENSKIRLETISGPNITSTGFGIYMFKPDYEYNFWRANIYNVQVENNTDGVELGSGEFYAIKSLSAPLITNFYANKPISVPTDSVYQYGIFSNPNFKIR